VTKPQELANFKIQYADWSPTGQHIVSNWLNKIWFSFPLVQALVIDYDLYLFDPGQPAVAPLPLTTGGAQFAVHNGIPDWVYEGLFTIFG